MSLRNVFRRNPVFMIGFVAVSALFILGQSLVFAQNDGTDIRTTVGTHGQSIATMTNQLDGMVTKLQKMDGKIGSAQKHNVDQDKVVEDVQNRMQTLEDKISILTSQIQELKKEGLLKPTTATRFDEYQEYSRALEYVNAKDYRKAIASLKSFQKSHSKSVYKNYAQYWIGEAYYMQGDFPLAIKEYQKLISKSPRSSKASAALYKQGVSFMQLQSFDDAKAFFKKVVRSYPRTLEASQANSQIHRINQILAARQRQEIQGRM